MEEEKNIPKEPEGIKQDIQIDADDMYKFQMYHTYHTGQGILSIVLGIVSIAAGIVLFVSGSERITTLDVVFYIGVGLVFIGYYPISMKKKAPMMISGSAILSHPLHYTFSESGITVEADAAANVAEAESRAVLPWENIFKVTLTKEQLLIYSNKVNAYILPLSKVSDLDNIKALIEKKVADYRLDFK